jgi:hypothetical protein
MTPLALRTPCQLPRLHRNPPDLRYLLDAREFIAEDEADGEVEGRAGWDSHAGSEFCTDLILLARDKKMGDVVGGAEEGAGEVEFGTKG